MLTNSTHWESIAAQEIIKGAWDLLIPPPPMSITEWAESRRLLSPEETALPGRFNLNATPVLRGILAACSNPKYRKVVNQKPAQIGYTAGVVCNVMGYYIDHKPSVQVAVFPREKSAKDFSAEKLDPMIRATPSLSEKVALKSRAAGNSITRKNFPGGLIKLVGSNSPGDVKSTSARVVIIEEPDDANSDVRGQGDSIKLAEERAKTYPDHLILIGGTPTAKGASSIEAEMQISDQRHFWITCPHCQGRHTPAWENVIIPKAPDDVPQREVYGPYRWEDASYLCPHCGVILTEEERIAAIRLAANQAPDYGWEATCDSTVAGFYANELMSVFHGSRVPILARKYLEAKDKMEKGDPNEMVVFWNSTLGLPWEYKGELPEEDELRDRAEQYEEWTAPPGALIALLSVDVQHDRLALTCWVFGRGEEMWLAYWGEVYGSTITPHAGAWLELEEILGKRVGPLGILACAIDCSDGQTSEASYSFVRKHNRRDRQVIAVKGHADAEGKKEIWTPPKAIDPNHKSTKASKYGVQIHMVGTAKAKDLILGHSQDGGRVRLTGSGHGRMHWYDSVRPDFYEQLLSEIKIPSRFNPKRKIWKARTDRRNEALDCTVYAVYLYRHLKLHLRRPAQWDLDELRLRQGTLLTPVDPAYADGDDAKLVQTSSSGSPDADATVSPENAPKNEPATDDALEALTAAGAKQAWETMMRARKESRRG